MKIELPIVKLATVVWLLFCSASLFSAELVLSSLSVDSRGYFEPLEEVTLAGVSGETVKVFDGKGIAYHSMPAAPVLRFNVGGNLGEQKVVVYDKKGVEIDRISFVANAETKIDDGGRYSDMFKLFYKGMCSFSPDGTRSDTYNGKTRTYFHNWGLDHYHTMKGMQYFSPIGGEWVDLSAEFQDESGFIYSFIATDKMYSPFHFKLGYGPLGFFNMIDEENQVYLCRQPVENHCEYIHVNTVYLAWQASGDTTWMKGLLPSCAKALDYSVADKLRYSKRYGLLKRVYTIDSWDFQAVDKYLPDLGLNSTMLLDAEKSKFGVFYGDNHGYILACEELSQMYDVAGDKINSDRYALRAADMRERLDNLSWNGRFFTHFIEEDPTVARDFGVDEKSQISQSNCYAINRNLKPEQNKAIIESYLDLKNNLPKGSPGEWYAIYPPFEKGFGTHNKKWQYMNGGVAGHAAGELAQGAYESGYEAYATDILTRLYNLGMQLGGDRVAFAFTGAYPDPPVPDYTTLDLSKFANMDITADSRGKKVLNWMGESNRGNDVAGMPSGRQMFDGIPFYLTNPETNKYASVVALSNKEGYLRQVEIPVNKTAGSIYVVHNGGSENPEKVCGSLTFLYDDGTYASTYIVHGKHLASWWYPKSPNSPYTGVAWRGPNAKTGDVGVYWAVFDNPNPEKTIKSLRFSAASDNSQYALLALTLSDQPHYVKPPLKSFGGPDNWSAGTTMYAMIKGLAGAQDQPGSVAFKAPLVAPRWMSTTAGKVDVTVRYEASDGYVAYSYEYLPKERKMVFNVAGNAPNMAFHVLLPKGVSQVKEVRSGGKVLPASCSLIEESHYVDFNSDVNGVQEIEIFLY